MDKSIVGERLKALREGVHLSQAKLADYFDVSLDYIFGRTDAPQGKLYQNHPKVTIDHAQMRDFLEMCFDPNSPANAKFKEAILRLFEETTE